MELANRDEIEAKFAARVARLHGKFRTRLIELLGSPPDPTRVPDSFWIEVEDEMRRDIAIALLLISRASALQHGLGIDVSTRNWAEIRAQIVARPFTRNSRDLLADRFAMPQAVPPTAEEIAADIFSPSRADTIATTETTTATSAGGEIAVSQTVGMTELDTWFTAEDDKVCSICGPLHGVHRSKWMAEFPLGPPAHPNCRCYIEYAAEKAPLN